MIWKRLRQYADEREKAEESAPPAEKVPRVTFRERLVMTLVAYVVILLPCALVLVGLALLALWLFGLL